MRLTVCVGYADFYRMSLGLNVAFGSKADKRSRAKIHLYPLWSNSGQPQALLVCPLRVKTGLMHCKK
jgi:hypothetical protein